MIIFILVPSWIVYCTKLITDCFCAFDTKPKDNEDPYVLLADKVLIWLVFDGKAFGKVGVILLQLCFVITVYGIAVAYEVSFMYCVKYRSLGTIYSQISLVKNRSLVRCGSGELCIALLRFLFLF